VTGSILFVIVGSAAGRDYSIEQRWLIGLIVFFFTLVSGGIFVLNR
jgi:hypothetical protein